MIRKRLIYQLFFSFLLVIILAMGLTAGYLRWSFKAFFLERTSADLTARAYLLVDGLQPLIQAQDLTAINELCQRTGKASGTRITVIRPNGEVMGDSEQNPLQMHNHANRAEMAQALDGKIGHAIRYSQTLKHEMMYVGVPVWQGSELLGVVRTAIPLAAIDQAFKNAMLNMLGGLLLALLAATGLSLMLSKRFSDPIEELKKGAQVFAKGDYSLRLPIPDSEELADLAQTINQVADQLDQRIQTIVRQRNELETVLISMIEGVIAVDMQENIISVNQAAADMFVAKDREDGKAKTQGRKKPAGLDPHQDQNQAKRAKAWEGKGIQEMVRNTMFLRLVRQGLAEAAPVEGDTLLFHDQERILHIRVSPLRDFKDLQRGVLIVMTDVTQVRRLENMRRDFAANVSHELKTPLTAIKGFVETLQDGALTQPAEAVRFLGIIAKHVARLEAIIEDLMRLSQIEQANGTRKIDLQLHALAPLVSNACHLCREQIQTKTIDMQTAVPPEIQFRMDPLLLEQALVNLIDNAVKYSHPGGRVSISAAVVESEVNLRIEDTGIGIAKPHLPRLFERFYRVDPARSRSQGGTGLGLAIVKHIVQAHDGHIQVESVLGRGTCFTLHLPANLSPRLPDLPASGEVLHAEQS